MKNNPILIISTSALALIMSACGQNFKANGDTTSGVGVTACSSAACSGGSTSATGTSGGTLSTQQQLSQVDLNGTVSSGIFSNMKFLELDTVANTLDIELPMGSNPLGINAVYKIPQLPGATAGMLQDSSGNWFLGVKIPLSAIAHGVTLGNSQKLPNGNALPGIATGELPSLELNIGGQIPIHLYLGVNVAAAFVELPQTDKYMAYLSYIPFQLSFDLKNSSKAVIGEVAPIAPVTMGGTKYSGGVYVETVLPAAAAILLAARWAAISS